jgi:hypothetical protein
MLPLIELLNNIPNKNSNQFKEIYQLFINDLINELSFYNDSINSFIKFCRIEIISTLKDQIQIQLFDYFTNKNLTSISFNIKNNTIFDDYSEYKLKKCDLESDPQFYYYDNSHHIYIFPDPRKILK